MGLATGCLLFTQSAYATTYGRRNPTDVIPPDWTGRWNCNLDGRPAVLELNLANTTVCNGNICSTTFGTRIAGRISDNGGPWVGIEQRAFAAGDPPTARTDHMLPLRYNNTANWMLMMHTWNRNFASGYSTWNGIPFGLQCRR